MKRKKNVIENLRAYEKQAEAKPSRKKKKSKSRKTSFEKQEKRNGSFREKTADYINKNTL